MLIWCHLMPFYQLLPLSISPCLPPFTVYSNTTVQTNSFLTETSMSVQMRNKYGCAGTEQREREIRKERKKTFLQRIKPYGIESVGWNSRERKSGRDWVWKRGLLAYPAWFCPGLDPTSSHVSEGAGAQCYPDVRKRGKKDHNIPIIRSAFLIHTHSLSHKYLW